MITKKIINTESKKFINLYFTEDYDGQIFVANLPHKRDLHEEDNMKKLFNVYVGHLTEVEIRLDSDIELTHNFSDEIVLSDAEIEYNTKYKIEEDNNLFYSLKSSPRATKLLVTFRGFSPPPVMYCASVMKRIEDDSTAILAFSDRYFQSGSYYMYDNDFNSIADKVIAKIKETLATLNIKEENLVLFGSSKGASAALMYFDSFPKAICISGEPQLDILEYTRTRFTRFEYFQMYKGYPDIEHLLKKYESENRRFYVASRNVNSIFNLTGKLDNKYIFWSNHDTSKNEGANHGSSSLQIHIFLTDVILNGKDAHYFEIKDRLEVLADNGAWNFIVDGHTLAQVNY